MRIRNLSHLIKTILILIIFIQLFSMVCTASLNQHNITIIKQKNTQCANSSIKGIQNRSDNLSKFTSNQSISGYITVHNTTSPGTRLKITTTPTTTQKIQSTSSTQKSQETDLKLNSPENTGTKSETPNNLWETITSTNSGSSGLTGNNPQILIGSTPQIQVTATNLILSPPYLLNNAVGTGSGVSTAIINEPTVSVQAALLGQAPQDQFHIQPISQSLFSGSGYFQHQF